MDRHLFLFGGSPPFTNKLAKWFVKIALKSSKPVSVLIVEREGWEQYMPKYTLALEKQGVTDFFFFPLPTSPIEEIMQCLNNSSGIIIGGGNTNLYADYIVETPISKQIKECYEKGIPVAGFSAGALISPEHCIISPKDNEQHKFQQRKGLGLVSEIVIAVHFSQWGDEEHLREAVSKFKNYKNFGIDERTGVYFLNGQPKEMEGEGVYSIKNGLLRRLL
ncbi:Type 1 glutamine amidotransferase-like domain-containing protein [Bacillus litorisediminis]|uniref:Type 1 glutamine amidotransferase-like domain-containing protein n=1 Tax=Bacillus litorisediminis TaxID=2922713 RepID=UPI001FAC5BFF|nr:Type 1 glutamine amidotransferase-like domain-containing protein [Bacillus litorisediminis]